VTATETQSQQSLTTASEWPSSLKRLDAALIDAKTRLTVITERLPQAHATTPRSDSTSETARADACRRLIDEADGFAIKARGLFRRRSCEFIAWDCLAQADRQMVFLMSAAERSALWTALKAEATSKLADHRKAAVLELSQPNPERLDLAVLWESMKTQRARNGGELCEEDVQKLIVATKEAAPSAETVCAVMLQIQTHSQNHYHKLDQLERQISVAAAILVVLVFVSMVGASFGPDLCSSGTSHMLLVGMLMGLFGGVLSLVFSIIRTDTRARIPAMRASLAVAFIRPFIGAAIALPVLAIVQAGVIQVKGADLCWVVAAACFLAGFSERWFLGLTERFQSKANDGQ